MPFRKAIGLCTMRQSVVVRVVRRGNAFGGDNDSGNTKIDTDGDIMDCRLAQDVKADDGKSVEKQHVKEGMLLRRRRRSHRKRFVMILKLWHALR